MGSEPNAYGSTPDPWPIPPHYDVTPRGSMSVENRLRALEVRCAGYEAAMPRVVRRLQAVEAELQRLQREGFKSSD